VYGGAFIAGQFKIVRGKQEEYVKLRERLVARRQRKAHQRHLQKRARQEALRGRDAQDSVRGVAQGSAGAQQGMYGQN